MGSQTENKEIILELQNELTSQVTSKTEAKSLNQSPNVLIYLNDSSKTSQFMELFKSVLDDEKYTLYCASKETIKNSSWKRAALVIVIGESKDDANYFVEYFLEAGKLFCINADPIKIVTQYHEVNESFRKVYDRLKVHCMDYSMFEKDKQSNTVSCYRSTSTGVAIIAKIDINDLVRDLHCRTIFLDNVRNIIGDKLGFYLKDPSTTQVEYTKAYLFGDKEKKDAFKRHLTPYARIFRDIHLQWCNQHEKPKEKPSETFLPIYLNEVSSNFYTKEYFDNLTSTDIGQLLIYSDVLTSTMDITKGRLVHGIAVVAKRQIKGRGRRNNSWITPEGQAAIAVQIRQKVSSILPLIQHAAALAVILAIRSGVHEKLDIKIKWPNDIYYGHKAKIGGVLTSADTCGDDVQINIGTGVNISNSAPTMCLNEIIGEYNKTHKNNLPQISIEKFLARFCSQLEIVLNCLNKGDLEIFLQQYYKYWLHSKEEIQINQGDTIVNGTTVGINEVGSLVVRVDGNEIAVTPDGNTFDMMSGLIAPSLL